MYCQLQLTKVKNHKIDGRKAVNLFISNFVYNRQFSSKSLYEVNTTCKFKGLVTNEIEHKNLRLPLKFMQHFMY